MQAAERKGIKLMKDDLTFIKKHLPSLPYNLRKSILRRYIEIWHQTMAECESEILGMNLGRRSANMYLLEQTNGFTELK